MPDSTTPRTHVQDHEPWCNKGYDHPGDCQSGQGLNEEQIMPDFTTPSPEDWREQDEFADAVKYLAGKIPVELHTPRTPPGYRDTYPPRHISIHTPIPLSGSNAATISIEQPDRDAELRYAANGTCRNGARVIGLGGYQEHGKDAVADILVKEFGFEKFGMSDAINEILLELNPPIDYLTAGGLTRLVRYAAYVEEHGYVEAKKHKEVRRLLRMLGTEVGRDMIDPDIWVNAMRKKIRASLDNGKRVAVTGIRNGGNEIDLIRDEFGGTLIWVERPGHPIPDTAHASENSLSVEDFDLPLSNDGTLEDLRRTVAVTFYALRAYERR